MLPQVLKSSEVPVVQPHQVRYQVRWDVMLCYVRTHYQTPSPHWLRYHPSEAICLLHHVCRRAHSIAEISVRTQEIGNYYPDPDQACFHCYFVPYLVHRLFQVEWSGRCLFTDCYVDGRMMVKFSTVWVYLMCKTVVTHLPVIRSN